jgi:hypothetical protein
MTTETEDEEDNGFSRRRALIAFAGVGAGGLALINLSSTPVMAATLTINDDTLTTDNGAVTGVTISVSGDVTWDGAENEPGQTDIRLQVRDESDSNWETVATEDAGELTGLAGTYSYSFSGADITTTSWNNGDFNANGDGSSTDTTLTFRIEVEPTGDLDGDGNTPDTFTSSTDDATLTVNNEANSNNAGGNGGINGQGSNNSP